MMGIIYYTASNPQKSTKVVSTESGSSVYFYSALPASLFYGI